ncbi:uncharacterized protein LOC111408609 isoform X2 [Olea europaea var. sylvestris]|uniref:uncharacterized protein LOC111408609 isoform X2 n=1 Tax=Olea europaea var. sylvestris TaxID=158386 RepID=UPI000C1D3ED3|nr:uncharacterized protein LOC111408609 isoform X2 [Olea europaea var. sylvestris]
MKKKKSNQSISPKSSSLSVISPKFDPSFQPISSLPKHQPPAVAQLRHTPYLRRHPHLRQLLNNSVRLLKRYPGKKSVDKFQFYYHLLLWFPCGMLLYLLKNVQNFGFVQQTNIVLLTEAICEVKTST